MRLGSYLTPVFSCILIFRGDTILLIAASINSGGKMKIAITADCHLTTPDKNPERYNVLINLIKECKYSGIEHLLFAGDIFDQDTNNPALFESLFQNLGDDLHIIILPGNHDAGLSNRSFTNPSIRVITQPEWFETGTSTRLLLIPYKGLTNMGDQVAEIMTPEKMERFVLVSHGDWLGNKNIRNNYEPGTYMPLLAADINQFQPIQVILGHIHIPYSDGRVHYVGSPCGLDITETGQRSFVVYDTTSESIKRQPLDTDVIFLNYKIAIFPHDDELSMIQTKFNRQLAKENLTPSQLEKIKLRLEIIGCSQNKSAVKESAILWLRQIGITNCEILTDSLRNNDDIVLKQLAEMVSIKINSEFFLDSAGFPTKEEILHQAMETLYGGRQ